MPVNPDFREYVLEQLGRVLPVMGKSMFGGVGIYSEGLFFALIADDRVFVAVDDTNRPDFERAAQQPFRPFKNETKAISYYSLPEDLLEDPESLRPWLEGALNAARNRRTRPGKRSGRSGD